MASSSSSATDSSVSDESQLMEILSIISSDIKYRLVLEESSVYISSQKDYAKNWQYNFPGEYDKRREIFLRVIRATASSKFVEILSIDLDEESVQQTDFVKHIAEMIRVNTSVKRLVLSRLHGMMLDSAAVIGSALSDNHALHSLHLIFNGLEVDSVDEVLKVLLAGNHVLKLLDIETEGRRELPAAMLHGINNTSTRRLRLNGFWIGSAGAATIGTALGSNNTLEGLDLFNADMGADGVLEAILQPLACTANKQPLNTTLKRVQLTYCSTGSKATSALANMLRNNPSLLRLSLIDSLRNVSEEDICSLLESLTKNTCLEELDLSHNESVAGEKVFATIEDLLASNLSLKILIIEDTPLAREGKEAVIEARLESEVRREQAVLLKEMAVVSPKAARVFLCGEPYAGKTTLRKSMMYSTSHPTMKLAGSCVNLISRMPFMERLLHGSELRTRGVEVDFLAVGNTHLTLWDMAGQKEFHAFHDLVVPNLSGGGSSSLFLLVCNPFDNSMNVKPTEDIKNELQYWLQFIASNTRRSNIFKPHVIIVVTHGDQSNINHLFYTIEEFAMHELKRDYGSVTKVDLYDKPLDVRSISLVSQFVDKLKNDLASILKDLPNIFEACGKMQLHIDKWNQQHPNQPLILWDEFVYLCKNKSIYKKRDHEDSQNIEERFYRVIAASLHEVGQVLYFEELEFVVVNPNWFCHEIMGRLINGQLVSSLDNGFFYKRVFEKVIAQSLSTNRKYHVKKKFESKHLVKLMEKLKLVYEDPNMEGKIFVPATLKDENQNFNLHQWKSTCKDDVYIGRRLQCNDKIRTSLTLGFFPRLQVFFHEKFGPSNQSAADYSLAQNTIEFLYNGMDIKLQCTSEIGYDIDIFVRSSNNKEKTLDFVQKSLAKDITNLCADKILGCQRVVLVEGILRPKCVRSLTTRKYRKNQSVLVETLKQSVLKMPDLEYSHSWETEPDVNATPLLSEHEWEDVLDRRYQNLKDFYGLFKPSIEEPELSSPPIQSASQPRVVERSFSGLIKLIEEKDARDQQRHTEVINRIGEAEDRILQKTKDIIDFQEKLQLELFRKVDQVIDFSWQLQKRQVPRYVYFTAIDVPFGVGTIVTKLVPGIQKVQLHLMCEHKSGFHTVEGQEGITLTVTTELAQKILPILKWSLKIIFLLIKVGAHVAAGVGNMIPQLDKMVIYALDAGAFDEVALGAEWTVTLECAKVK